MQGIWDNTKFKHAHCTINRDWKKTLKKQTVASSTSKTYVAYCSDGQSRIYLKFNESP